MASMMDKVKDKLTGHTTDPTNTGPHDTKAATQADPTIDSVADSGANPQIGASGDSTLSNSSTFGAGTSRNAGPHPTNVGNKLDPRVDSDLDHRANPASSVPSTIGMTNTAGSGMTDTTGTLDASSGGVTGTGNKDFGTTSAAGPTGVEDSTGTTVPPEFGGVSTSGPAPNTAGPHSSDMANKVDPRVDSDLDGSRTVGGHRQ